MTTPEIDGHAEEQIAEVAAMVASLCQTDFYGSVKVKFEQGRIVHLERNESIRPKAWRQKPGPATK